jgi:hypothetical protein
MLEAASGAGVLRQSECQNDGARGTRSLSEDWRPRWEHWHLIHGDELTQEWLGSTWSALTLTLPTYPTYMMIVYTEVSTFCCHGRSGINVYSVLYTRYPKGPLDG